jgi:hypothetical protein
MSYASTTEETFRDAGSRFLAVLGASTDLSPDRLAALSLLASRAVLSASESSAFAPRVSPAMADLLNLVGHQLDNACRQAGAILELASPPEPPAA